MRLSIILPCYNEVDNVPKLEREFLPLVSGLVGSLVIDRATVRSIEVVLVDDGSRDGTWLALNEAFGQLRLLGVSFEFARHPQNLGLGAALRTGFSMATGDVVVTTDCDGTYAFSTIPALLACLEESVDMVTASPYHPDGDVAGVPAYRLILSQGSSLIYRFLVDWHIHTYTALFRAYRREVVDNVPFAADGFLAGTELMVKGMLAGYRVAEYPTVLHQRAFGVSKAKLLRTITAHLRFQGRILMHRLHLVNVNRNTSAVVGDQQWT